MGKLVVSTFLSLDGVMQSAGYPDEDRDGGFAHGGWLAPFFDDAVQEVVIDRIGQVDGLLLGRRTYQGHAAHWPHVSDDDPIAARLNRIPKYVVSRTLTRVEWNNSILLTGDIPAEVAKVKQSPEAGTIQVDGSSRLVRTLMEHDLIDEYRLFTFPVLIGTGKRLFADGTVPVALERIETTTAGAALLHTYAPRGALQQGSVAPG